MLTLLREELLGCVLQHLAPADLRAARQAAKLLDAASRNQLDAAATLHLTPHNTDDGLPTFARFPRLRRIVFMEWDASADEAAHLQKLRMYCPSTDKPHELCIRIKNAFMDTQPEHLAGVTEVAVLHSAYTLSQALALLLGVRLCNVTCLHVGGEGARPIDLNTLAAVVMTAPQLQRLRVHVLYCSDHVVEILTKAAPHLKSLTVSYVGNYRISGKGMHMVAARLVQLTSLDFERACADVYVPMDAAVDIGRLQQLRVLRGISLPFGCVEMLAAGLPQLRVLEIAPDGDWGVTSAVFRSVLHLKLTGGGSAGFCKAPALGRLFPSLQHLIVFFDQFRENCRDVVGHHVPLARLTGLLSLKLDMEAQAWPLAPGQWGAIAVMSNLRQLKCDIRTADARELCRLALRGLRALDVWFWEYWADDEPAFNPGKVLVQIGRSFPCLQALNVVLPCDEDDPVPISSAMLSEFMHSVPLLEHLVLDYNDMMYDQVCSLAAHSNLRVLKLPGIFPASEELQQLAIQCAERGLTIKFFKQGRHYEYDEVFDESPTVGLE